MSLKAGQEARPGEGRQLQGRAAGAWGARCGLHGEPRAQGHESPDAQAPPSCAASRQEALRSGW